MGKLLKQKCINKSTDCFGEEIRKEENYHFTKPVGLNEDLRKVFPECSKQGEMRGRVSRGNCAEKERVFKDLRRTVLLEPDSWDFWEVLSCIYKEAGFSVNGKFLDRIALSSSREKITNTLKSFVESENIGKKLIAARLAGNMGGEEGVRILDTLSGDSEVKVKAGVALIAGEIGGEEGVRILDTLSGDEKAFVRKEVARAVQKLSIDVKKGFRILEKLAEDPDPKVQKLAKYLLKDIRLSLSSLVVL